MATGFMDFLNNLAGAWREGAEQGLEEDWTTRRSLEKEKKRLRELFPIQLEQEEELLKRRQPYELEKIKARQKLTPQKRTLVKADKGLLYDADTGQWIQAPPGMVAPEAEENPLGTWRKLAGLDPNTGLPEPADIPAGEQIEGFGGRERPNLIEAVKSQANLGPREQVMIGTSVQGKPMLQMRTQPMPAGDVNALAASIAEQLEAAGWDPVDARTEATAVATKVLGRRRYETTRSGELAATEPDVIQRRAQRQAAEEGAGELARWNVQMGRPAFGVPGLNIPGAPVTSQLINPPSKGPQPEVSDITPPPEINTRAGLLAWHRSRANEQAQNIPAQLRADTAATLLVNKQLKAIEDSSALETYSWTLQQKKSGLRDWAAGWTKGVVPQDPQFIKFRQMVRNIRLQAFDFGGKQLTNTEKEFVLETVPDGNERTPNEMREKIAGLRERREFLLSVWQRFANMPAAKYQAAVDQAIRDYQLRGVSKTIDID